MGAARAPRTDVDVAGGDLLAEGHRSIGVHTWHGERPGPPPAAIFTTIVVNFTVALPDNMSWQGKTLAICDHHWQKTCLKLETFKISPPTVSVYVCTKPGCGALKIHAKDIQHIVSGVGEG